MSGKIEYIKRNVIKPCKHYCIGPFQFLAISLIVSESLLGLWLWKVKDYSDSTERIVAGAFSIAVLVAVIVVSCVVYWVKRKYDSEMTGKIKE